MLLAAGFDVSSKPLCQDQCQRCGAATPWRKALAIATGLGLLQVISQSVWPALALFTVGLMAYAWAWACWQGRSPGGLRRLGLAAVLAPPLALATIVLLNLSGFIGTLTGSREGVATSSSHLWLAAPFYLLSAAAFVADTAGRGAKMPCLLDSLVYMTWPFKLLAGPLETPRLIEQISRCDFKLRFSRFRAGWPWIGMGAFMKFAVADRLNPAAHLDLTDPLSSLLVATIFELKFYFDFAGYSFMAYGGSLTMGLRISQNFDHPFLARNVVVFWRRWHISLGRYLAHYLVEPHVRKLATRNLKLLFISSIVMASALWHGGTLNYLLWGIFHASCYYSFVRWFKHRRWPAGLGMASMLLFFVIGRMLAIDNNTPRLIERLQGLFDPHAYLHGAAVADLLASSMPTSEWLGLGAAGLFLMAEFISTRLYPKRQGYHLLRRPLAALLLVVLFVLMGLDAQTLLYARI